MSKLLIVNADDLGRTPGINRGIFEAHRDGLVTSATLMVAYDAAAAAAAELEDHPDLGVGLHVALTGGPPLLAARRLPSLVDAEGRLPRKPEDFGELDAGEVLAEVEAQLARFRMLTGRLPTHLDSHHHSHRSPVVLEALITAARRHRLPVRNASPAVRQRLLAAGVATTDAFDETFFGDAATLDGLLARLSRVEPGTTELMCHPAHADDELRESSTYDDDRERELAVLCDPRALEAVRRQGIHLVHFGRVVGRAA